MVVHKTIERFFFWRVPGGSATKVNRRRLALSPVLQGACVPLSARAVTPLPRLLNSDRTRLPLSCCLVIVINIAGQWPPLEFAVALSCRSDPQAAVLARLAPCLAHARLDDPHWVLFQGLGDLSQLGRGGVGPGT